MTTKEDADMEIGIDTTRPLEERISAAWLNRRLRNHSKPRRCATSPEGFHGVARRLNAKIEDGPTGEYIVLHLPPHGDRLFLVVDPSMLGDFAAFVGVDDGTRSARHVGQIRYYMKDGKMTCLVALRRADTDELDWFAVGAKPFFADRVEPEVENPRG